jgi:hypothetical protein
VQKNFAARNPCGQRRDLPLEGETENSLFNHFMRMAHDETAGGNS